VEIVEQQNSGAFIEINFVLHSSQELDGLFENALWVLASAVQIFIVHNKLNEV
jgi:hypothetical protein